MGGLLQWGKALLIGQTVGKWTAIEKKSKGLLTSKTTLGIIAMVVTWLVARGGLDIVGADALVIAEQVAVIGGAAVAIWGRWAATTRMGKLPQ